jgi:peptide/nickel transport system substrate-binding protein
LKKDSKVKVHKGPGGEIRYIVFNFDTMPFGAKAADADAKKALAVRQAMANLLTATPSRTRSTRAPTCPCTPSFPADFLGANESFKDDVRRRQRQARAWTRPRRRPDRRRHYRPVST